VLIEELLFFQLLRLNVVHTFFAASKYLQHQNICRIKIFAASKYLQHQNTCRIKIFAASKYLPHQNTCRIKISAPSIHGGQTENKTTAAGGQIFHPDLATMQLYNCLANC
jgi:hypothetical protein